MKEKKTKTQVASTPAAGLFEKHNLVLMIAGAVVIAIGMFLMGGGKSTDPNVFNEKEVYRFAYGSGKRKISIANLPCNIIEPKWIILTFVKVCY